MFCTLPPSVRRQKNLVPKEVVVFDSPINTVKLTMTQYAAHDPPLWDHAVVWANQFFLTMLQSTCVNDFWLWNGLQWSFCRVQWLPQIPPSGGSLLWLLDQLPQSLTTSVTPVGTLVAVTTLKSHSWTTLSNLFYWRVASWPSNWLVKSRIFLSAPAKQPVLHGEQQRSRRRPKVKEA